MFTAIIQVQVKPDCIEAFRAATRLNVRASRQEPGITQFDLLQQADAPERFLLIEEYRDADAQLRHRETPHYLAWRETAAPMMAAPRSALNYTDVEPR
jgi:quinol monooxygenase YgiN